MAHETSPLLLLPRELREVIYGFTLRPVKLCGPEDDKSHYDPKKRNSWDPHLTLTQVPERGLLLSCTQIHDEYEQYSRKNSRQTLSISLFQNDLSQATPFNEHARLPPQLLRTVSLCCLKVSWTCLVPLMEGKYRKGPWSWRSICKRTPDEMEWLQGLPSTPTKSLCKYLRRILRILRDTIHPYAEVQIQFILEGLPENRLSPYPGPLSPAVRKLFQPAENMAKVFYAPWIELVLDTDELRWPEPGRLRLSFWTITPLSCPHPNAMDDPNALDFGRLVLREESADDDSNGPMVDFVLWELIPTKRKRSWRGFLPNVLAIVREDGKNIQGEVQPL